MKKETKIVHVQIVDGEPAQLKALRDNLKILKKKLDFNIEFLITNDKIKMRDVKYLLKELYSLYKKMKEDKK